MFKVECQFCHKINEIPSDDVLEGLNVHECQFCKQGIVWNNVTKKD